MATAKEVADAGKISGTVPIEAKSKTPQVGGAGKAATSLKAHSEKVAVAMGHPSEAEMKTRKSGY